MDALDELPAESRREVEAEIRLVLGVGQEAAENILRTSEPLWNALEDAGGLVDSWGGGEFCGIFPQMCAVVRNPPTPDGPKEDSSVSGG